MSQYLLGLDCGHTVTKAVVFDLAGKEISSGKGINEVISLHPGWQERTMESAATAAITAIKQAVSGLDTGKIISVGVCGHSDGLYLLDKAKQPLRNAIFATDNRAKAISENLSKTVGAKMMELIGQHLFPASAAALLVWLKENEPENFRNLGYLLSCKDWIRTVLTDTVGTDISDASGAFAHIKTHQNSSELITALGLTEITSAIQNPVYATEIVGQITDAVAKQTGLKAGTPVIAGSHDVHSAAIGVGAYEMGETSLIFGTWSINQVFANEPKPDWRWHTRASVEPNRWLHMCTSPASASNANWFWDVMGIKDQEELTKTISEADKSFKDKDRPLFFPYLFGGPAGTSVGASFVGMRGWHSKYDLAASVMEGVVFNHKHHFDMLSEKLDTTKRIIATGGSMQSKVWAQLVADIFNREIELSDTEESGARGVALLAGVGVGIFKSIPESIEKCVGIRGSVKPNPDRVSLYRERYQRYRSEALSLIGV